MEPAYINYFASVIFATLTLVLFFMYFLTLKSPTGMILVVLASGAAWASAYAGVYYVLSENVLWRVVAQTFLSVSVVIVTALIILAIRTRFYG
jgi:hypothetical protein